MLCDSLSASASYDNGYILSAELDTTIAGGRTSSLRYERYVGSDNDGSGIGNGGNGSSNGSNVSGSGVNSVNGSGSGNNGSGSGNGGNGVNGSGNGSGNSGNGIGNNGSGSGIGNDGNGDSGSSGNSNAAVAGEAQWLDKDAVSIGLTVAMSVLDAVLGLHKTRFAYEPAAQGAGDGGRDGEGRITFSLAGNQIPSFLSVSLPAISGIVARFGSPAGEPGAAEAGAGDRSAAAGGSRSAGSAEGVAHGAGASAVAGDGAGSGADAAGEGTGAAGTGSEASATDEGASGGQSMSGIAGNAFQPFLEAGGDSYLPPLMITVERLDVSAQRAPGNLIDNIGVRAVFTVADSQSKSYEVEFSARLDFAYGTAH
jgi:hypothetical protein